MTESPAAQSAQSEHAKPMQPPGSTVFRKASVIEGHRIYEQVRLEPTKSTNFSLKAALPGESRAGRGADLPEGL
jgi:hypothetical protein